MHLSDEILSTLVDGRLAAAEQSAARAHLAGCAACAQRLAELEAVVRLLRALPEVEPSREFVLGPRRLAAEPRVRQLAAWYGASRAFAAGAAALFLVLVAANIYVGATVGTESSRVAERRTAALAAPAAAPAARPAASPVSAAAAPASASSAGAAGQVPPAPTSVVAAPAPQAPAPPATVAPAPPLPPEPGDVRAPLRAAAAALGGLALLGLIVALVSRRRLRRAQAIQTFLPTDREENFHA